MRVGFIAAGALLAYGAWLYYQDAVDQANQDTGDGTDGTGDWLTTADQALADTANNAADWLNSITGGILNIGNMTKAKPDMLNNRNVQAMLKVIRKAEGTDGPDGYRMLFGKSLFNSYADHPRQTIKASGYTSSAAGAYQIKASTWDETAQIMGLTDFSPASQDLAALGRIAARGALDDVLAGRLDTAIKKINREWASLPGSPYGQPTISMATARSLFLAYGGNDAGTVYA